jgi:hypothetical protein
MHLPYRDLRAALRPMDDLPEWPGRMPRSIGEIRL